MDNYDVIKKLIGPIQPVGSTHVDAERYRNLEETISVVDRLLSDIDRIATKKKAPEHSIKRAANRASKFFDDLGIEQ